MSKRTVLALLGAVALTAASAAAAHALPIWFHVSYLDPAGNEVGYRHLLCDGTWLSSGSTAGRPVYTSGSCTP